jgi:hypothetical protein
VTTDAVRVDRAVWSFWTRPLGEHYAAQWASERFHALSWILSFETVSCHFRETALVTDEAGASLLVDRLGLDFDHVSTALEDLSDADPRWWVLGKLNTYRIQERPYIHFDSDVYLWRPLPDRLLTADIATQNREWASTTDVTCYKPSAVTATVVDNGGWLPPAWLAYVRAGGGTAFCTGLVGGCAVDSLHRYADRAIAVIEHEPNRHIWDTFGVGLAHQLLVEQYYLAAFYLDVPGVLGRRLGVQHLFRSEQDAFDNRQSADAGYTHLIARAKLDPVNDERVAERVRRDYPARYARCEALLRGGTRTNPRAPAPR